MDELLKYFLPNDAPQRIAGRHAAIFVGVIVVAGLIALGNNALEIISASIRQLVEPDHFDLALTTTSISIVIASVFASTVYGTFLLRKWLIKCWAGHHVLAIFMRISSDDWQPYGMSSMQLLENAQQLLDPNELEQRSRREMAEEKAKSMAAANKRVELIARNDRLKAQSEKASALDRLMNVFHAWRNARQIEEQEAIIRKNDEGGAHFQETASAATQRMQALVENIVAKLDGLQTHLALGEKLDSTSAETIAASEKKKETLPLRGDELILYWSGADDCQVACTSLGNELEEANSKARADLASWIAKEGYAALVRKICGRLKEDIVDLPYFAPSRVNESNEERGYRFDAGTRFGAVVARTSLGKGVLFMRETPMAHYYANADEIVDELNLDRRNGALNV